MAGSFVSLFLGAYHAPLGQRFRLLGDAAIGGGGLVVVYSLD